MPRRAASAVDRKQAGALDLAAEDGTSRRSARTSAWNSRSETNRIIPTPTINRINVYIYKSAEGRNEP